MAVVDELKPYPRRIISCLLLFSTLAACSGCAGIMIDRTSSALTERPIPLRAPPEATSDFDRWACQPNDDSRQATKDDFLIAWGEPLRKEINGNTEVWHYAEGRRWCGVWIAFGLPIPILLPVCETYDEVTFESSLSVRARSKRFVRAGFGFTLVPAYPGFLPVLTRAGNADENSPAIAMFPPQESDRRCRWPEAETWQKASSVFGR